MTLHWTSFARSGLCALAVAGAALAHAQTAPAVSPVSTDAANATHAVQPHDPHKQHTKPHHHKDKAHHRHDKAKKGKYATPQQHEAAAVREERRRGEGPGHAHGAQLNEFERNALRRCDVFKNRDDHRACVERVRQPQISGSVQGGGVLREYTQTIEIPAQPQPMRQPQ